MRLVRAVWIAAALCASAAAQCDRDPVCLAKRGAELGAEGKLEESSALFERALRLNPDDWATRRNLASNQFQMGRLAEARRNLEAVRKQNPADRIAVLLLGMVTEELKDYPAAIRHLSGVPDLVALRPQSVAALARAYYRTGARKKAAALLSGSPDAGLTGAQVAAGANDFATAERLLANVPPSYEAAAILYRAERFAQSESLLRRLLERGSGAAEVFNLLGWCRYKQGDVKEAIAALDLAIDRAPGDAANYIDVGLILLAAGRAPAALDAAKKAADAAPGSYQAHMLKGLAEARSNLLDAAAASYRRAAELRPDAPEPLVALGVVLNAAGRTGEAESTFEGGLRKFPRHAALYQEYGKLLAADGRTDRAAQLLARAVELNPKLAEPHLQLGRLALDDNKPAAALPHLELAVRLAPRRSAIHFALARAYREMERPQDAARELALFEKTRADERKPAPAAAVRGALPEMPDLPARDARN